MKNKFKNLQNKIYSMSNSFLPLDMFYNDIRDNPLDNYNKEQAYKDIEKIANFIIDLQGQLAKKDQRIAELEKGLVELKEEIYQKQLAVQELEKVKDFAFKNTVLGIETVAIINQINQQIKKLKGE